MTITVDSLPTPQAGETNQSPGKQFADAPSQWWTIFPTIAIAFFTLALGSIAYFQYRTSKDQVAIMRLAHRAIVIVQSVAVDGFDQGELGNKIYNPRAVAINIGASDATILHIQMRWHFERFLPLENPLVHLEMPDNAVTHLKPGGTTVLKAEDFPMDFTLFRALWGQGKGSHQDPNGKRLFLFGVIKYLDESKNERRTYFCRHLDPAERRFVYVPNTDYEYTY